MKGIKLTDLSVKQVMDMIFSGGLKLITREDIEEGLMKQIKENWKDIKPHLKDLRSDEAAQMCYNYSYTYDSTVMIIKSDKELWIRPADEIWINFYNTEKPGIFEVSGSMAWGEIAEFCDDVFSGTITEEIIDEKEDIREIDITDFKLLNGFGENLFLFNTYFGKGGEINWKNEDCWEYS